MAEQHRVLISVQHQDKELRRFYQDSSPPEKLRTSNSGQIRSLARKNKSAAGQNKKTSIVAQSRRFQMAIPMVPTVRIIRAYRRK